MSISVERKAELRRKLAVMIDLAWRSDEFEDADLLSPEDQEYVQARIDAIILRLV